MIEKGVVEEILARTDIESLISSYVSLRRAGANMQGLCPFHSEKTPSFVVFGGKNSFYCFGCGAGGDAINFVRRVENLEFEDAVEFLGKRAGITVTRTEGDRSRPRYDRKRMFTMNRDAARFFHASLHTEKEDAVEALRYLTERRGLDAATLKHFGIGYAPSESGAFYRHMQRLGYTDDELIAGFLCGRTDSGRVYDAFRSRVMFPIIDVSGNIIAFGGRLIDTVQKANPNLSKYKNSSDTPVFLKRRNLFALNFARQSCAERMILCEGYMDVIALHAAGFTNAIATLGTAITAEQARLMSQYTRSVIIAYDSDDAGRGAAEKAMRLLAQVGLDVRILRMDGAKDPDEYIKKFGAAGFRRLLDASRSKFEYRLETALETYNIALPEEKIKAIAYMTEQISGIASEAERDVYVSEVAKRFDVDRKSLANDVARSLKRKQRAGEKERITAMKQASLGYADRVNPDYARAPDIARCEEAVLGLLLSYPEHRQSVLMDDSVLCEADFFSALGKRVFTYLRDAERSEDGFSESMMSAVFSPEEMGRITHMRVLRMDLTDNGHEVLMESIATLKRLVLDKKSTSGGGSAETLAAILASKRQENK